MNNNNNYNPYGYGNYPFPYNNPLYNNYQQPTYPYGQFNQPQVQPQPQQPTQYKQYTFVNGIEGAKAFQLGNNQTMMLLDSENPIIYKKTSNEQGQSTIQYYKMIEISEDEVKNLNIAELDELYASKEDVEAINKKIDNLYRKLEMKKGK